LPIERERTRKKEKGGGNGNHVAWLLTGFVFVLFVYCVGIFLITLVRNKTTTIPNN
jgi:hypothetical protein